MTACNNGGVIGSAPCEGLHISVSLQLHPKDAGYPDGTAHAVQTRLKHVRVVGVLQADAE